MKYDGDYKYKGPKRGALIGCPDEVTGYFYCDGYRLTSLVGAPSIVGWYFSCEHNNITSLEGLSTTVGSVFYCRYNNLTSLHNVHKQVRSCTAFWCGGNKIESHILGLLLIPNLTYIGSHMPAIELIAKYVGKGKPGILQAQRDLIDAGLEEFAEL